MKIVVRVQDHCTMQGVGKSIYMCFFFRLIEIIYIRLIRISCPLPCLRLQRSGSLSRLKAAGGETVHAGGETEQGFPLAALLCDFLRVFFAKKVKTSKKGNRHTLPRSSIGVSPEQTEWMGLKIPCKGTRAGGVRNRGVYLAAFRKFLRCLCGFFRQWIFLGAFGCFSPELKRRLFPRHNSSSSGVFLSQSFRLIASSGCCPAGAASGSAAAASNFSEVYHAFSHWSPGRSDYTCLARRPLAPRQFRGCLG